MMTDPRNAAEGALVLIRRCLSGEAAALGEFQQIYGELVYGYPLRAYRVQAEDAGDFYVFAFDKGRIFSRLRTFEGRIPLQAYLLGTVLDNLMLEWKRGQHEIDTVSIDTLSDIPDTGASADVAATDDPEAGTALQALLSSLDTPKRALLKLLHIEDYELAAAEVRCLAEVAGRTVPEILEQVERMRATIRGREAGLKRIQDAVEAVHAWIQLYERRLRRIADDRAALPPSAATATRLRDEQQELERKLAWRREQHRTLLGRAQRRKVTTPYKDIAALLNTSIGNVASQIARLRKQLKKDTP